MNHCFQEIMLLLIFSEHDLGTFEMLLHHIFFRNFSEIAIVLTHFMGNSVYIVLISESITKVSIHNQLYEIRQLTDKQTSA